MKKIKELIKKSFDKGVEWDKKNPREGREEVQSNSLPE